MTRDTRPPLLIGQPVTVVCATYSAVPVHTTAKVVRVRRDHGGKNAHLYEIEGYPEYPFWERELAVKETEHDH